MRARVDRARLGKSPTGAWEYFVHKKRAGRPRGVLRPGDRGFVEENVADLPRLRPSVVTLVRPQPRRLQARLPLRRDGAVRVEEAQAAVGENNPWQGRVRETLLQKHRPHNNTPAMSSCISPPSDPDGDEVNLTRPRGATFATHSTRESPTTQERGSPHRRNPQTGTGAPGRRNGDPQLDHEHGASWRR